MKANFKMYCENTCILWCYRILRKILRHRYFVNLYIKSCLGMYVVKLRPNFVFITLSLLKIAAVYKRFIPFHTQIFKNQILRQI